MYKLLKIGLLDTIATDTNLEKLLDRAINEFKSVNTKDSRYEIEIVTDDYESIFRGSIILVDKIVENALNLARKYHYGDIRKGDGLQYIIHILQLTNLLYYKGFDAEVITAGFCHDLLEDTACPEKEIEENCGKEPLRIVKAVSNDKKLEDKKDWERKKEKYIESVIKGGEKAITVCIADKIVNLRALLKEYKKSGEKIWTRFNRGKEKKLWFEKMVYSMAKANWKNSLLDEYLGLINKLEKI